MLAMIKIAAGLLAGASVLTLVAPLAGELIATLPPSFSERGGNPETRLGLAYEEVEFPTTDGLTLRGWFIPAARPAAQAILYAPATHHDQRSGLSLVPAFHEAGYHVLLFSYRGHARSDGRPGAFTYGHAESQDVDAAVQFLTQQKGIARVAVIGHSAGAVSALLSAARNPRVGAIIAVAPFAAVDEVWYSNRPALVPRFILDWTFWVVERARGFRRASIRPLDVVAQIAPRPLLIIHGTGDRRISEEQVQRLFGAARGPKALWLVEGATHSGVRSPVLDHLAPEIVAFLDEGWRSQRVELPARRQAGVLARIGTQPIWQ